MRVLLICESLGPTDGWSRYSAHLRSALMQAGHEVFVCCARSEALDRESPLLQSPTSYLRKPLRALRSAHNVRQLCRELQPDLIHFCVEPYATMAPFMGKSNARIMVLTVHGTYGVRWASHRVGRFLGRLYHARIRHFIAVSNYTRDRTREALEMWGNAATAGDFSESVHVIPNGIELPPFEPRKRREGPKQILTVGMVKARKGILEAVDACAAYKERYSTPFEFGIIGKLDESSEYVRMLRQRIRDRGLEREVELRGVLPQPELEAAYRRADLYLMPGRPVEDAFEGFGLVYLEANAHGVPCIGPKVGGGAEAISEGYSGFLVDPDDTEGIAERMHQVLDESRIAPEACRSWAEQHSLKNFGSAVEAVYQKVLSTR